MKAKELRYLVKADAYRCYRSTGIKAVIKGIRSGIGFKYIFWMRMCGYFRGKLYFWPLLFIAQKMLKRCIFRFGIEIDPSTSIGPGFFIRHFSGIFIFPSVKIGRNFTISQGVTIGKKYRGEKTGVPVIGDNVFIGPGAKILGKITVGNNVAIGANAVVTKDVPENAVVVGIPARVISYDGSGGCVRRIDYDDYIVDLKSS